MPGPLKSTWNWLVELARRGTSNLRGTEDRVNHLILGTLPKHGRLPLRGTDPAGLAISAMTV